MKVKTMLYHSILFPYGRPDEQVSEELLGDLRIDSVLLKLSHGPDQLKYDTCYLPLTDKESVLFRHAVFQDMIRCELYKDFMSFQEMMDSLRLMEDQMKRLRLPVMRQRYFLNRMIEYKKHVLYLLDSLEHSDLRSEGLKQFRKDLSDYAASDEFRKLSEETEDLKIKLQEIIFTISIRDNHVTIKKLAPDCLDQEGRTGFEQEIYHFFGQFTKSRTPFPPVGPGGLELNPVEEEILNALMTLFPEPFSLLEKYYKKQSSFVPKELVSYHQDMGFYTIWLEYILPKQDAGLSFCFPMITEPSAGFVASNCFDLVLTDKMREDVHQVIRNNLVLHPGEHVLVLTGPNQGGKTTYARMIGQLFYLASLGVPVPGSVVKIFLPDHIFTHFERQESQQTLNGKLKDDIVRIHDILERATGSSLILINEMFSSTTLRDADWLAKKILDRVAGIGCFCLYVTFINALSDYLPGTVSLISQIGEDGQKRTYQILRAEPDGKAYAKSMVNQYALTYEAIKERIGTHERTSVIQGQNIRSGPG